MKLIIRRFFFEIILILIFIILFLNFLIKILKKIILKRFFNDRVYLNSLLEETKNLKTENLLLSLNNNSNGIKSNKKIKNLNPIIIIPDIGFNKLYAKWDLKNKQKKWFNIWLNNNLLDPSFKNSKFLKKLIIEFYKNKNKNIKITPWRHNNYENGNFKLTKDFGGLDGINMSENKFNIYKNLIELLKKNKYKSKKNLYAVTYDFFKIAETDIMDLFFKKLKDLLEFSFKANNKNAILISHGFGSNLFQLFLNYYLPKVVKDDIQEWKDKYIKNLIMVNANLGGSTLYLKSLISGDFNGIGIASYKRKNIKWFNDIEKNISSFYLSLPNIELFLNKEILFNINIGNDILSYMKENVKNYMQIFRLQKYFLLPPKINLTIISSSCVKGTPIQLNYDNNILKKQKYETKFYLDKTENKIFDILVNSTDNKKGDGLIPFISQQIPFLWGKNNILPNIGNNNKYYDIKFLRINTKYSSHQKIFENEEFFDKLTNILNQ